MHIVAVAGSGAGGTTGGGTIREDPESIRERGEGEEGGEGNKTHHHHHLSPLSVSASLALVNTLVQERTIRVWYPSIPESFTCGGASDGVVVVSRVVDQEELIPRGGAVVEVSEPLVHL